MCRCRVQFRKARLGAKKRLVQAQRLERELMVQSYSLPGTPTTDTMDGGDTQNDDTQSRLPTQTNAELRQQLFARQRGAKGQDHAGSILTEKDRQTVGASSRVTDSLRQMHASLQSELERSEYANQTMRESTAAFQQLHESYSSLETMLTSSRDLLGTLLRSQKSDTWYLTTALYMLLTVGAWLVFRRLLYGPLWWLVWLPLRILFGVGAKTGSAVVGSRDQQSPSGDVVGEPGSKTIVDGLPDQKDLPTAKVGGDEEQEKVDKLMDHVAEVVKEQGVEEQQQQEQQPVEDTRPRDEL